MSEINTIRGGVCAPKGFQAASTHCGIKRTNSTKDDLALVYSEVPAVGAGVFTTNVVKAASVYLCQKHLRSKQVRAVLLNSGNANACTGTQGDSDAAEMATLAGKALAVGEKEVLVCSTGRIGVPLPMEKIARGVSAAADSLSKKHHRAAARAIMTSDTVPKEVAVEIKSSQGTYRIGAMAKGAGMINPNMATMLCVVTTDADVPKVFLKKILAEVVEATFNRITVDGDMSTNDTVLLLANAQSGVKLSPKNESDVELFRAGLQHCCTNLARKIVQDGEGTERVIELEIRTAKTARDAKLAAEAAANSVLLKCAWAGADPNWGRIVDAVGYSGACFDPRRIDVYYDDVLLVSRGEPVAGAETAARRVAKKKEFRVVVDLNAGKAGVTVLTTDLTEEYVRLNLSE
ncbi:MAG: bifunctional glutamate N-acetyltransferase/amino-acid acetyltransferase ArgJ [Chthoniobacterales bacterium]